MYIELECLYFYLPTIKRKVKISEILENYMEHDIKFYDTMYNNEFTMCNFDNKLNFLNYILSNINTKLVMTDDFDFIPISKTTLITNLLSEYNPLNEHVLKEHNPKKCTICQLNKIGYTI